MRHINNNNGTKDLEKLQRLCSDCEFKGSSFFCDLPEAEVQRFAARKVTRAYSKGSVLFVEGQPVEAAYMLCQGRVKLSSSSSDGKVVILGVAGAGELLGLSAALSDGEYEMTAEVLEPSQINVLTATDLSSLLTDCPAACLKAARQLARNYRAAHQQICSLSLSDTVSDKLAKLFLDWSGNGHCETNVVTLANSFTHSEMAEMIGVSRETVTRVLGYFRQNDLVTIKGTELIIHDRKRLRGVIGTRPGIRS